MVIRQIRTHLGLASLPDTWSGLLRAPDRVGLSSDRPWRRTGLCMVALARFHVRKLRKARSANFTPGSLAEGSRCSSFLALLTLEWGDSGRPLQ